MATSTNHGRRVSFFFPVSFLPFTCFLLPLLVDFLLGGFAPRSGRRRMF
jgi:hypothetical protein